MFGAVNARFSGLAFAGIIITILLQMDELKQQRKELEFQRDELTMTRGTLNAQKIQMEAQTITLRRTRFEGMFFKMLEFHFRNLETIDVSSQIGVNGIRLFLQEVFNGIPAMVTEKKLNIEMLVDAFQSARTTTGIASTISSYDLGLMTLYSTIINNRKQPRVRKRYFAILIAYISDTERQYIYLYNLYLRRKRGNRLREDWTGLIRDLRLDVLGKRSIEGRFECKIVGEIKSEVTEHE